MTDYSAPEPVVREHAFLALGERLRQRGQLDAAVAVAQAGLSHYPALAEAHDLLGRVCADNGDLEAAQSAWRAALDCDAGHPGAHKGLAFLAFRRNDLPQAERHLEAALQRAPHDPALLAALDRVRSARPTPAAEVQLSLDDPTNGILLFDPQGMRLAGGVDPGGGEASADAGAAEASGLAREAARATRLLGLGSWHRLVIESNERRIALVPVTADVNLLVVRPASTPVGRLLAVATRAIFLARDWLGRMT